MNKWPSINSDMFMYIEKTFKHFHFQAYFMFIKYFKYKYILLNNIFF